MDEALLDTIYAAAAIPELWKDVLQQISHLAGGHAGALIANRKDDLPRYVVTETYGGDRFHQIFQTTVEYPNPRPARALAKYPMCFSTDLELCTAAELNADPIYRDGLRPHGFDWSAGTAIPVPSGDLMVFDLVRRSGSKPFDRVGMEAIDPYRPHLARSALMAARLRLEQAHAATGALEKIGLPAASVTPNGSVVAANDIFSTLGPRLRIAAWDKLEADDLNILSMIHQGIEANNSAVRSIPIPATAESPALVVHIIPVRQAAFDIFTRSSAIVVVTPVVAPDAPLTSVITGLFDLTPAEARIAGGIAAGLTVDEIAAKFSVSSLTVRTQLKAIFGKTATGRQSDLALLLSSARTPK